MKKTFLALALVATFAAPAFASSHDHAHHPHGAEAVQLHLNDGKQWQTDTPLREQMDALATTVRSYVPAIHANKMSKADYKALAGKIDSTIAGIVKNCSLQPEADAMLHLVIAKLASASDAMKSGKASAKAGAAHQAAMALNNYGQFFDHPGWSAIQ